MSDFTKFYTLNWPWLYFWKIYVCRNPWDVKAASTVLSVTDHYIVTLKLQQVAYWILLLNAQQYPLSSYLRIPSYFFFFSNNRARLLCSWEREVKSLVLIRNLLKSNESKSKSDRNNLLMIPKSNRHVSEDEKDSEESPRLRYVKISTARPTRMAAGHKYFKRNNLELI